MFSFALISLSSDNAYAKDITVFVKSNFIETENITGFEWEPGSMLTLEIDYGAEGIIDYTDTKQVGPEGYVGFDAEGSFTVGEGDLVRMFDDEILQTVAEHYVQYFTLSDVNPETNTLTGSAREGSQVDVRVFDPALPHPEGPDLSDVADASEIWSVDFTGVFDIVSGNIGWIMVVEGGGFTGRSGLKITSGSVVCQGDFSSSHSVTGGQCSFAAQQSDEALANARRALRPSQFHQPNRSLGCLLPSL